MMADWAEIKQTVTYFIIIYCILNGIKAFNIFYLVSAADLLSRHVSRFKSAKYETNANISNANSLAISNRICYLLRTVCLLGTITITTITIIIIVIVSTYITDPLLQIILLIIIIRVQMWQQPWQTWYR